MIFLNVNKAHQLAKYWTSTDGEGKKSWHLSARPARTHCSREDFELISFSPPVATDKSFLDRSFFADNESEMQQFFSASIALIKYTGRFCLR
jgi:hypothetical protein